MDATSIVNTVQTTTEALGVARNDIPLLAFGVSVAAWIHFFIVYYKAKIKCPNLDCTEIEKTKTKIDTLLAKMEKLEDSSAINRQVHAELLKTLQDLRIEVAILSGVSTSAFNMQKPRRPIGESRENFNNLKGDSDV